MKSLWTAVALVLLINFLALAGGALWLHSSGRLSQERFAQLVAMFSPTVAEAEKTKTDEEKKKKQADADALEAARLQRVAEGPNELAARIAEDQEKDEVAMQRYERLKRDIADLQRTNELARRLLAEERTKLETERKAFQMALDTEQKKRNDEDFKQAVKMYEQLKAKQAKEMFQQLLANNNSDQVLDYLAAMQLRKAAAVLKEFKTPAEVTQATDIVQRLRQRGVNLPVEAAAAKPPGADS